MTKKTTKSSSSRINKKKSTTKKGTRKKVNTSIKGKKKRHNLSLEQNSPRKLTTSANIQLHNKDFNPNHFFNRDLSWLSFNARVLHEALDKRTPLLERLRFMSIWRSNNDEFFMKRVGSLFKKIYNEASNPYLYGQSALELYSEIQKQVHFQQQVLSKCFHEELQPQLQNDGHKFVNWSELSDTETQAMFSYFKSNIFPILTPLAVDSGHPFPFISNLSKSIGLCLTRPKERTKRFARVKIPTEIPQWVRLPATDKYEFRFIHIEQIISANLNSLFSGMNIVDHCLFRLTRNASMEDDGDDDAEDKLEWVEEGLKVRKFAPVVRLEVLGNSSHWIKQFLMSELDIDEDSAYTIDSLPFYTNFNEVIDIGKKKHKYKRFSPRIPQFFEHKNADSSIFSQIRKSDTLIHFPYESFSHSVEAFVKAAAVDPKVRAIKIILYRTDTDGRLIDALIEAAENNKQVACIIELKARFDEERNIQWAQKLEEAGIHVSYGLMEYKTHAKMIIVVRQDSDCIRSYVNIGTGNYNSQTSKLYTDYSLFTCKPNICNEVIEVFNYLTGRSIREDYKNLLVAPFTMFKRFIKLIHAEAQNAKAGREAQIIVKMNQLEDKEIIKALYKASQAGVKITLFVRGFCSLIPGVTDLSENIQVYSIVGRLLEHSRIYYFQSGASDPTNGQFYLGSADWMSRNLFDRVEVITPIEQENLKKELWYYLELISKDNRHLWYLKSDGTYVQRMADAKKSELNSQLHLLKDKNKEKAKR